MDKIIQAEFRGLFWGEGCLDIVKYFSKKRNQHFYRPRIRIGMNIKEEPLIKEIQKLFGGWISYRKVTNAVSWELQGKKRLEKILPYLEGGILSAYKKKEIIVFREAVKLIPTQGKKYTTKERKGMERLYIKLQELKYAS
jgi:hypothetical protein